jgi:mono/diheme cytochrome c family protein
MKSLQISTLFLAVFFLVSCGSSSKKAEQESTTTETTNTQEVVIEEDISQKGKVAYVDLSDTIEQELVSKGRIVFDNKCSQCHHLTDEVKVGPGWAGITNRRDAEWVMNMIINVNIMKEFDSLAHAVSESSMAEMPEQYLSVDKARAVLEFMRQNDLDQTGTKDEGSDNS